VFLFLMGSIMAGLSFLIDEAIEHLQESHYIFYQGIKEEHLGNFAGYFVWVIFPLILVLLSVFSTNKISPAAVGSGIPEMKTILRSPTIHKEYIKARVLIAKLFGLILALGSRLPVGKEGPFVHIACMIAIQLCKLQNFTLGKRTEDTRMVELLSAACAVGVSCCFAAPIGGVLFSIEVTSTYFAVRDYWRAFFGSVMSALVFRIAAVFWSHEETLTALFRTSFRVDFPFDLVEIIAFIVIGIVAGLASANFVIFHKYLTKQVPKLFKTRSQQTYLFPAIFAFIYSTLTYPGGLGRMIAGELDNKEVLTMLFNNKTWSDIDCIDESDYLPEEVNLTTSATDCIKAFGWDRLSGRPMGAHLYVSLTLFILIEYIASALCQTIKFPVGVFMPVFMIGAAFGRLVGESMFAWFPQGFKGQTIIPGGYAVVGAAAFAGGVTHTISTSVIVFELTGQISHVLPVLLAVLVSNAVAQMFTPSLYESIIILKKLPHLPDLNSHKIYNVSVDKFMNKDVTMIDVNADARRIRELLGNFKYSVFPLVDSPTNRILIGSITRTEMSRSIEMSMTRPLESASVNPAPAMVSDKISLHRLHTMFSLLSLKRAYVVSAGRLVGVVGVSELTQEIIGAAESFNLRERAQSESSLTSLVPNQIMDESEDDDEVVIGDFTSNYTHHSSKYSRIRNQSSAL